MRLQVVGAKEEGAEAGCIGYIIYKRLLSSSLGTIALTSKMTSIGSHHAIDPGRIGSFQQHHRQRMQFTTTIPVGVESGGDREGVIR
jgi:hypothetical protein